MAKKKTEDAAPADAPAVDTAADGGAADDRIKKKQIYDHVTVATGLRKREVRESVDATLAYLRRCLDEGKELQLPPLGKVKVVTRGEGAKAKTLYKLILQKAKADEKDGAEAKEALEAGNEGQ